MSFVGSNILAGASGQGGADYEIERSLRFNSGDSAFLNRNFGSSGNRRTYTISFWIKLADNPSGDNVIAGHMVSGFQTQTMIRINNLQYLEFGQFTGSWNFRKITQRVFRDFGAWYHIVWSVDTTLSTAEDRIKLYVNGVRETAWSTNTNPSQNLETLFNSNVDHAIGKAQPVTQNYGNYYLADVHMIDGQALNYTSFTEFDTNGVLQPKAYSGTYGTNGFHLDFKDNSSNAALGTDTSGNSNTWTVNNLTASDGSLASPVREAFSTIDSGWTASDSNFTGTYGNAGSYAHIITGALNGSSTYHFYLEQYAASQDTYAGWFFSDTTNPTATVPNELQGNSLGLRVGNQSAGTYGSYATVNSTSSAQDQINLSAIAANTNAGAATTAEFVINMTARKVWVRAAGSSTWIGNGDPSNSSSAASFLLPTGTVYFGYVGYRNGTYVKQKTALIDPASIDSLVDTPTNGDTASDTGAGGEVVGNYATWNPLEKSANVTLSNGNLESTVSGSWISVLSTIGMTSGKWYWELTLANNVQIGVCGSKTQRLGSYLESDPTAWVLQTDNGAVYTGASGGVSTGVTWASGDIVNMAYDRDTTSIWFGKNGTWVLSGNPTGGTNPVVTNAGPGSTGRTMMVGLSIQTGSGGSINFGQRAFAYTAPTGFKALCTSNLPEPTIADGSLYFDTTLWSGNDTQRDITGLGFSPDLTWIKQRSGAANHSLMDTVRGATKNLVPNDSQSEGTEPGYLNAFLSDGFSIGTSSVVNDGSSTYVAWAWDAGTATNPVGDTWQSSATKYIGVKFASASGGTVSYGQSSGSTTVEVWTSSNNSSWTQQGGTQTLSTGHTLTTSDQYVFIRNTSDATFTNWYAAATNGADGHYSSATYPSGASWSGPAYSDYDWRADGGTPNNDGSIFSIVRASATSGFSIVSYTGTGSNATIGHNLNSAPDVVITKSLTGTNSWAVYHRYSGNGGALLLNVSDAEDASIAYWNYTHPTSTVFSVGTSNQTNGSGQPFIAYCFSPVEGYSSFGSWIGTGDANGPCLFTGFRPAWIMYKKKNGTGNWAIRDTKRSPSNVSNTTLVAETSEVESTHSVWDVDILSNGFKIRTTSSGSNNSGDTYVYLAFAENPFKTARAR